MKRGAKKLKCQISRMGEMTNLKFYSTDFSDLHTNSEAQSVDKFIAFSIFLLSFDDFALPKLKLLQESNFRIFMF